MPSQPAQTHHTQHQQQPKYMKFFKRKENKDKKKTYNIENEKERTRNAFHLMMFRKQNNIEVRVE
jgi:hypothetical protein